MTGKGRQIVRKPVEFNLNNEQDRLAWEYAKGLQIFAGTVKQGLAAAQHNTEQGGTAQP